MAILPAEIRTVVAAEDDFGHELRVGGVLRAADDIARKFRWRCNVEHGGTYTDPATGKPRQFDYRCSIVKDRQRLSLAVECKSLSQSVGLAICGVERQKNEAFHDLIGSNKSNSGLARTMPACHSGTCRSDWNSSFYPTDKFVGKSLVRIQQDKNKLGRTADADIYDKWSQALASAKDLVEAGCSWSQTLPHQEKVYTAILPVVVVPDDRLWTVTYDENGTIAFDPAPAKDCQFFVGRSIEVGDAPQRHQFTFSHVHFFTLGGLRSFMSEVAGEGNTWDRLFVFNPREIGPV